MKQTFTPNEIVKFLYRETPAREGQLIKQFLAKNQEVKRTYEQMLEAKKQLPAVMFNAHPHVIEQVLAYSTTSHFENA